MNLFFLFAIGAGLLNGLVALTMKAAERKACRPASYGMVYMTVAALLSLGVALGQHTGWSGTAFWVLGLAGGAFYYGMIRFIMRANALGPASLAWIMANMALLVPILLSAIFLGESLRLMGALILGVFVMMVAAFHRGQKSAADVRPDNLRLYVLMLLLVFLCTGGLIFTFKLYGHAYPSISSARASAVMYTVAALLYALDQLVRGATLKPARAEVGLGVATGSAGGGATLFALAAMSLPAGAVFPVIQGGGLLAGVVLIALVFGERMNIWKVIGVVLSLAVVVLSVFR